MKIDRGTVKTCVPRQDGGYMVVLVEGGAASSAFKVREGARVILRGGVVTGGGAPP